jgi:23S rRNA (cytidine1920-2'-O)/16S rRNA (cytidine1409-2'-O)-methyltransferase
MLQNGARKVYAVDVGTNQLAWSLRSDERVVPMEKTNIRYLTSDKLDDKIGFASVDVSFISLTKILSPVWDLLDNHAHMVCLIKPQFEAGREKVGKKGVVRDEKVHIEVIKMVMTFAYNNRFTIKDISYSPIKGPEGNIEYLIYMYKDDEKSITEYTWDELESIDEVKDICAKVATVTGEAHSDLDK